MADRFEDLRTFLTAISAGGINAAAAELGIAKSAVSRRISDLEQRLAAGLVDRSNRRFALTAAGSEYARRAVAVLAALDDLDASVTSRQQPEAVSLCARAEILTHAIVPAITGVHSLLSEKIVLPHLSCAEGDNTDAIFDVVVSDRHLPKTSRFRLLFRSSSILCASPAHIAVHGTPQRPEELDHHPAITNGLLEPYWLLRGQTRKIVDVSLVSHDVQAAAAAAVAGLGLVQLPDFVAAAALANGQLVQVLRDNVPEPTDFHAFYREDASTGTHRLVDALALAFGASVDTPWQRASEHNDGNRQDMASQRPAASRRHGT